MYNVVEYDFFSLQATSGDMQCEDLEDFDLNPAGHVTSPADPFGRLKTVGQPIPLETAKVGIVSCIKHNHNLMHEHMFVTYTESS